MSPLEKFGAMVYRVWNRHDSMDLDGSDIQELALKAGVITEEPYNIEKHGEYLRDAWDYEEGVLCLQLAPGLAEIIEKAHAK